MATKPTLNVIGSDAFTGADITSDPHNENYELLNDFIDSVQSEKASTDSNLQSQINVHVLSGSAHVSSSLVNDSNVNGTKIRDALNTLKSNTESLNTSVTNRINSHVQGISERHNSDDILNTSELIASNITLALNLLKNEIDSIITGGTEVDPRLSQALVDITGVLWGNFKDLQDHWQEHYVLFNKQTSSYFKVKEQISADGKPQLVYEEVI